MYNDYPYEEGKRIPLLRLTGQGHKSVSQSAGGETRIRGVGVYYEEVFLVVPHSFVVHFAFTIGKKRGDTGRGSNNVHVHYSVPLGVVRGRD
jgi:hypothetical protein